MSESFQIAASRHYDRRQRRMGSDKSRVDLHWRLAVAIEHLGKTALVGRGHRLCVPSRTVREDQTAR